MDKTLNFATKVVSSLRHHGLRQAAADARARWDADHLVNMQCRVSMEEARQIDALCDYLGCTRYKLVRSLLLACMTLPRDPDDLQGDGPEAGLEIIQDKACEILDEVAILLAALDEARLIQAEQRETAALLEARVDQIESEARGPQQSGPDALPWEVADR